MSKKAFAYIFFELLPSFFLGIFVFIFIILMFQVLRLTDFALIHGADLRTLAKLVGFICISLLPALLPMSLLFAVILTYNRLSNDSEIIALKASGVSMWSIASPAGVLGLIICALSAQTTFQIAPWGNRQSEVLITQLGNTKAAANIKAGTFSDKFFNMVIYANEVNSEEGVLNDVFIFDETSDPPVTIIANQGILIPDSEMPGHKAMLRLINGEVHRTNKSHTKVSFQSSDIRLTDPIISKDREKSPQSLSFAEIQRGLEAGELTPENKILLQVEFHKRIAIATLCLTFALLGVGLGVNTNRRNPKAGGMILCVGLIVVYWALHLSCEGLARGGRLPVGPALWTPTAIYFMAALFSLRKIWN